MDFSKTKTQKKREAKVVEDLARELVDLPSSVLPKLPCDEEIRVEIRAAQSIEQFGARRRQIKYLAKLLRDVELSHLFNFLEEAQKSRLKENRIIQRLGQLRDRILHEDEEEEALKETKEEFPGLSLEILQDLAGKYRRTRNQRFSREIFRQLKIAQGHAEYEERLKDAEEKLEEECGEGHEEEL
ncbi:MAG: ribosome biogenesis factor YjgA [bacterium]